MSRYKRDTSQSLPYPILFDKRPIRHVYLINYTKLSKKVYSQIFNSNFTTYNGRFNPIVFTDGKTLSDEAMEFLKDFDPDVVHFLVKPKNTLLHKLNNNLSPYSIESHDPKSFFGSRDENIKIGTITDDLISKLEKYKPREISPLVFFDVKEMKSVLLKQFLKFNFGIYETYGTEQFSKVTNQKWLSVSNYKEVGDALISLSQPRSRDFYPIQLCSVPNSSREIDYSNESEHFTVVVGDSPSDIVHFWNHSLSARHWMRNNINEIWIPTAIAKNKEMQEGLNMMLQHFGARTGNNNNHCLHFVSFSLSDEELNEIAEALGKKPWCRKKVDVLQGKQIFPDYGKNKNYFTVPRGLEQYQAYTNEESLVVDEPVLPDGVYGGHWMLDVYIQYRPERYQYTNVRHWWRLPRRFGGATAGMMFPNKVTRVKENGIPSVLMQYRHEFSHDEASFTIKIPDTDQDIFRAYIYGDVHPYYGSNLLNDLTKNKKHFFIQKSDKGRYLNGLLELFGGLYPLFSQFDEPYWRKMFDVLANDKPSSDSKKKIAITNKLNKELIPFPKSKTESDEKIEWLAEYILKLTKELGANGKEIPFSTFLSCQMEAEELENSKDGKKITINKKRRLDIKERLLEDVQELTESGVLLAGIKPHCDHCGYANWLPVDTLGKKIECRGCGKEFFLPSEKPWLYKLNSLVLDSIREHGLVPVLLTLGQLYEGSRDSFIHTPSVDLFEIGRQRKYKHHGDLDIVCIQDGKFIMGEIKQSTSLFKEKHFTEMAKLAKEIKPDFLIFSAMNSDKPRKAFFDKNIAKLNLELEEYNVKAVYFSSQRRWRMHL